MSVYEIVKLVGTCVGLILGAIVFFVVVFRAMGWIDLWVKFKTGAVRIRPRDKAKKGRIGVNRSAARLRSKRLGEPKESNGLHDQTAQVQHRNGAIREQLVNRKNRFHGASDGDQITTEISAGDLETASSAAKRSNSPWLANPIRKRQTKWRPFSSSAGRRLSESRFAQKKKHSRFVKVSVSRESC